MIFTSVFGKLFIYVWSVENSHELYVLGILIMVRSFLMYYLIILCLGLYTPPHLPRGCINPAIFFVVVACLSAICVLVIAKA